MEADFGEVLNAFPNIVFTVGADGRADFVNRRWEEYTGLRWSAKDHWRWEDVVEPADLPLLNASRRASTDRETRECEARLRGSDGLFRWFLIGCRPVRTSSGQISTWCTIATDIDARKTAALAVAESEREARLILGTIAGMVALFTPDGRLNGSNQQLLDYFQLPLEELANWATNGITHPDDLQHCIETFTVSLRTGDPYDFETRFRRHDGVFRWFHIRGLPVRDEDGNIVRWYGLLTDIDDRRNAVDALRESQDNLQLIVNSLPGLIIVLRPDGSVETVNEQSFQFFGYDFAEHQKWQTNDIIHPDDRARAVALFAEAVGSGHSYEVVERLRRHDGVYRWFQVRGNPVRDHDGSTVRWYFLLNDIDDRKRAESALEDSEREFRHIVNMVPGMIILSRPDGTLDGSNQQLLDYFGIPLEQVQDWATNGITHPDDVQINIEKFMGSLKTGEPYHYESRYRRHDGEFRWFQVRGQPLTNTEGEIVRWYGLLTDIDDRKNVEEELRRSRAFLAAGQTVSSTGTFSWNVRTDELTLSDEWLRIFELDGEQVTLDRIKQRIHPDDLGFLAEKMNSVREVGGNLDYELRLLGRDGTTKYVRVISHAIDHQDGHRESLGAIQDVTQKRLVEEASDQLRAELARLTGFLSLGQMSAAIAHEVNQPISGILTNANTCLRMLSMEPPNITTALETARRTIRDANRATEVIVRLRALFGKRTISFGKLDLHDAVNEVVALLANDQKRNGIVIRTSFALELPPVNGDRVQLQQVISNLLRNSIDAVKGIRDRLKIIEIRTQIDEDGFVGLAVIDNGTGIDANSVSRMFEAFYTTKPDGMGIGLTICRSIIENHGGRLWADVSDGPGVTIHFSVPAYLVGEEASSAFA